MGDFVSNNHCLCIAAPAPEENRSAELLFQRMEDLTSGNESASNQVKLKDLPLFEFEVLATSTDNFSLINKLGQGGFGPVYKVNELNKNTYDNLIQG